MRATNPERLTREIDARTIAARRGRAWNGVDVPACACGADLRQEGGTVACTVCGRAVMPRRGER